MSKRLELELLTNCDQYCIYCSDNFKYVLNPDLNKEKKSYPKKSQQLENFKLCQNKIRQASGKIEEVVFIGDDCTSSPHLAKLIKMAKAYHYKKIKIITPGGVFSDKGKTKELINSGLTHVVVTLAGYDSKTHESVSLTHGSFNRLINGLKVLLENSIWLEVNIPLIKQSLDNIPKLLRLLRILRIDQVNLFIWYPNENRREYYEYLMPRFEEIIAVLRAVKTGRYTLNNMPFCLNPNKQIFNVIFSGLSDDVTKYFRKYVFCQKCEFATQCPGIYDLYTKKYDFNIFKK